MVFEGSNDMAEPEWRVEDRSGAAVHPVPRQAEGEGAGAPEGVPVGPQTQDCPSRRRPRTAGV